jgi:hypothetical protein
LQGQGPYSAQIKLLEKEITDEMGRVRELIGELSAILVE